MQCFLNYISNVGMETNLKGLYLNYDLGDVWTSVRLSMITEIRQGLEIISRIFRTCVYLLPGVVYKFMSYTSNLI